MLRLYSGTHTYTYTHTNTYTHEHIHTYMHAQVHTCTEVTGTYGYDELNSLVFKFLRLYLLIIKTFI